MILTPLQKLPKNGEDWGKLIVAKGFKKLPKVLNITQSGHTGSNGKYFTPKEKIFFLWKWKIAVQSFHVKYLNCIENVQSQIHDF